MSAVLDRDGGRCVACGTPVTGPAARSGHHRIGGDTTDNRPSNKLTLCGSGSTGCHGTRVHNYTRGRLDSGPRWARRMGYIVSRHGPRDATLTTPVWYNQPALARVGWFLLGDDHTLTPTKETTPCM